METPKITIEQEGKEQFLVIKSKLPSPKKMEASKSGKSDLLASTNGNLNTGIKFDGRDIIVGLNAYVKKEQ